MPFFLALLECITGNKNKNRFTIQFDLIKVRHDMGRWNTKWIWTYKFNNLWISLSSMLEWKNILFQCHKWLSIWFNLPSNRHFIPKIQRTVLGGGLLFCKGYLLCRQAKSQKNQNGEWGNRIPDLSHAKRTLCQLS